VIVHLETTHPNITRIDVTTAEDMYQAMVKAFPDHDVVIKAAAVADYRPKQTFKDKMKKQSGEWHIEMERTKDILQALGEQKQRQFLVGFAAETNNQLENGRKKLNNKHLDAIVINNVGAEDAGFEVDTNTVTYLNKYNETTELDRKSTRLNSSHVSISYA